MCQPLESGRIHVETTGAPGRRLVGHHVGRVPGQVPHEVSPERPDCRETVETSLRSVHPTGHQAGIGSAVVGSGFGAKQQLPNHNPTGHTRPLHRRVTCRVRGTNISGTPEESSGTNSTDFSGLNQTHGHKEGSSSKCELPGFSNTITVHKKGKKVVNDNAKM